VLATKASGVGPAARAIAPLMGLESMVITIQNGLGAGERIAEFMDTGRVLLGVADGFGASMKGPGHVHHSAMNLIRVGEMNGGMTGRLQQITGAWQQAGFNAQAFEDIDQLIWGKYICNVAFSGPCTAFDKTLGELMGAEDAWAIAQGCALEVYTLGQAKNIAFTFDDPIEYVTAFGRKMPDARPSMLLDHHARRPSEIDAINGMAVELGKQLGIPTPYNEVLTAVIRQREAAF
jgi:2-dehydropantoate 2-reductase